MTVGVSNLRVLEECLPRAPRRLANTLRANLCVGQGTSVLARTAAAGLLTACARAGNTLASALVGKQMRRMAL